MEETVTELRMLYENLQNELVLYEIMFTTTPRENE